MKVPKVVRKFMYSYLVVLAIPLITGVIIYQVSYNLAVKKSIQTSDIVLNQSKDILDRRFVEIDRLTRLLATNENLNRLLNSNEKNIETRLLEMRNLSRDLSTISQSNNMLSNIYLYLMDREVIITPATTYFRIDHYYENNLFENMNFEQWHQLLNEGSRTILPLQTIKTPYTKYNAISTYYPIPYNAIHNVKGVAVITIDEKKLLELFNRITTEYHGWAYILDQNNQLLAKYGIKDDEIRKNSNLNNGKLINGTFVNDDLIISTQSSSNRWTIVAGLPKSKVLYEANIIKKMTIFTVLLTILIGLSICFLLSYRNFIPIHRILKLFRLDENSSIYYKNEWSFLEGNVFRLVNANSSLKKEIEEQKPLIRSSILHQILQGQISIDKEIEDALEIAEIYFLGNNQTGNITILSISDYDIVEKKEDMDTIQALRIMIKNYIEENKIPFHLVNMKHNQIILIHIFAYNNLENQHIQHAQYLKEIHTFIKTINGIQVNFAVGYPFVKLTEINRSFRQAEDALRHAKLVNNPLGIIYYKHAEDKKSYYSYPMDIEIRILNALKSAQYEEVCHLIDEVFKWNIDEKELSPEMIFFFIQEIKATFIKEMQMWVYSYKQFKPEIDGLLNISLEDGIENIKERLKELSQKLCKSVLKQRSDLNDLTVKEIINFIENNYSDQNLGVAIICNHVNQTEKVMSALFKESTGFYISEYLEKCRLEKAEELLSMKEITIDEIAQCTGYNSAHSFRRAFKRVNGLTPNQFRKYVQEKSYEPLL